MTGVQTCALPICFPVTIHPALMYEGKKTVAEKILYKTLELIKAKTNDDPIKIFNDALDVGV